MKRLMMVPLVLLLICGCATQGRIRVLNLDFRKPDQIAAGKAEAEAPFKDWDACSTNAEAPVVAKIESLPLEWYTALFDMIAKLEARLCLFEIEWAGFKPEQSK